MQNRWLFKFSLIITLLLHSNSVFASSQSAIIIGGGSIGLMNAYYLNEAGYQVTLIEQADLASEASFGNAGVLFGQIPPLSSRTDAFFAFGDWLKNRSRGGTSGTFSWTFRLDRHFWNWLSKFGSNVLAPNRGAQAALDQLAHKSLELHGEIADKLARTTGQRLLNSQGRIEVYSSTAKLDAAEDEARKQLLPYERLSSQDLLALDPTLAQSAQGGIRYLNSASVNPQAYLLAIAEELEQRGVRFVLKQAVTGFDFEVDPKTDRFFIKTIRLSYLAPIAISSETQVILATGAGINRLTEPLGIKTLIEPAEGYHITINRPATFPDVPFTFNDEHIYVVPMGDQLRILGHLGLNGWNDTFNTAVSDHLLASFKRHYELPDEEQIVVQTRWKGRRPCTPDTLPIIDKLPQWDNLALTVGHCTHGMGLGPITGFLLRQILDGEVDPEFEQTLPYLREDRF